MGRFLRIVLPLILAAVFVVIALYVYNSIQSMELMETTQRAGPTLLNQ